MTTIKNKKFSGEIIGKLNKNPEEEKKDRIDRIYRFAHFIIESINIIEDKEEDYSSLKTSLEKNKSTIFFWRENFTEDEWKKIPSLKSKITITSFEITQGQSNYNDNFRITNLIKVLEYNNDDDDDIFI